MNPFEKNWADVKVDVKVEINPKEDILKGHRDITIVLDGSGSMESVKDSVQADLNKNFASMKANPGGSRWNMVQFDDPHSAKGAGEVFPRVVFENRAEKDLVPLTSGSYVPRGSTALVDALCLTMQSIDRRVSGREDYFKPTLMIVTDGMENASVEFNTAKMREMIAARQAKGWEFLYIGANQDAFAVTRDYGINSTNMANYNYQGASVAAGAVASGQVGTMSVPFGGLASGAIGSGFIGAFHVASGHLANIQLKASAAFGAVK